MPPSDLLVLDRPDVVPMTIDDPVADLVHAIAGVGLELYTRIVKATEIVNHDLSLLEPMAIAHGVPADAWGEARRGWNERIATEPAIRELFQVLYRAGAS